MKKIFRITILMMLSLLAISIALSSVYAYDYELQLRTNGGVTWSFSTTDINGEISFSGNDIISLTAEYWIGIDNTPLEPKKIVYTDGQVILIFDIAELPSETIDSTTVTGVLENGYTFRAAGPGFAWRRR